MHGTPPAVEKIRKQVSVSISYWEIGVCPVIRKSNKELPEAKALKNKSVPFTFSLNCEEMNMHPTPAMMTEQTCVGL